MGVNNLSRKLRDSNHRPDKLATSELVSNLAIGVDLSVICHKALNTNDGAGEFHMKPPCPNSEVRDKCTKICALANKGTKKCMKMVMKGPIGNDPEYAARKCTGY